MIIVKRGDFIAWTMGELMTRDASGNVLVGDHVDHERAEKAMENGETIGLTHKGVLVTKMRLEEDGFREFRDADCQDPE